MEWTRETRCRVIMELFNEYHRINIEQLSIELKIPVELIEEDINVLLREGKIDKLSKNIITKKTGNSVEPSYDVRNAMNTVVKNKIAMKATELIEHGNIIIIDEGSTTAQMGNYFDYSKSFTVVTNSFSLIEIMHKSVLKCEYPPEVMFLGGMVSFEHKRVTGVFSESNLEFINADKVFITADGFSAQGLSGHDLQKCALSREFMRRGRETIVLADQSKIGRDFHFNIDKLEAVSLIITDCEPPAELEKIVTNCGIGWICV